MLYYVSGEVTVLEPGLAVVDCHGVGYGCRVTAYTAAQLKLGKTAKLFITESIREDAFDLYGFISKEEEQTTNGRSLMTLYQTLDPTMPEAFHKPIYSPFLTQPVCFVYSFQQKEF